VKVSDLIANPRLAVETIRTNVLNNLRPGQILHASVLTPTDQNSVKLRIGVTELVARTQVPFTPGQRLTLDVIKTGLLPELRVLPQADTRTLQAQALRAALPKQIPLPRLFDNLQALSSTLAKNVPIPAVSKGVTTPAQWAKTLLPQVLPSSLRPSNATRLDTNILQTLRNLSGGESPLKKMDGEMLQALRSLAGTGSLQKIGERLGPELINRIGTVLENSANRNEMASPPLLRKIIQESGLFMESRLAAGQSTGSDLKSNLLLLLLHLRGQLEEFALPDQRGVVAEERAQASSLEAGISKLLTQLLRQTEGGLARLQLNQLASMPAEEGNRQVWQFDIPVRHPDGFDGFQLKVEREQAHGKGKDARYRWRVALHFDLEPLGPVQAQITLMGEEVSALFLTERKESAAVIEQHLSSLDRTFSQAGLKVAHLAAKKSGKVLPESPNSFPHKLLDEKA
jgi:hypothetical protein